MVGKLLISNKMFSGETSSKGSLAHFLSDVMGRGLLNNSVLAEVGGRSELAAIISILMPREDNWQGNVHKMTFIICDAVIGLTMGKAQRALSTRCGE